MSIHKTLIRFFLRGIIPIITLCIIALLCIFTFNIFYIIIGVVLLFVSFIYYLIIGIEFTMNLHFLESIVPSEENSNGTIGAFSNEICRYNMPLKITDGSDKMNRFNYVVCMQYDMYYLLHKVQNGSSVNFETEMLCILDLYLSNCNKDRYQYILNGAIRYAKNSLYMYENNIDCNPCFNNVPELFTTFYDGLPTSEYRQC